MSISYTFQAGYGFVIPELFESDHEDEIGEDGLYEYLDSLVYAYGDFDSPEFPLLAVITCGSMGYGGEGQFALVAKRTMKVFYAVDEFRVFEDFTTGHTHEEVNQLSNAAIKFGASYDDFKWMAGINVS